MTPRGKDTIRREISLPQILWEQLQTFFNDTGTTLSRWVAEHAREDLRKHVYFKRQAAPKPPATSPNFGPGRPVDGEEVKIFKERVSRISGYLRDYRKQWKNFPLEIAYYLEPLQLRLNQIIESKDVDGMDLFNKMAPWSNSTARTKFAQDHHNMTFLQFKDKQEKG